MAGLVERERTFTKGPVQLEVRHKAAILSKFMTCCIDRSWKNSVAKPKCKRRIMELSSSYLWSSFDSAIDANRHAGLKCLSCQELASTELSDWAQVAVVQD